MLTQLIDFTLKFHPKFLRAKKEDVVLKYVELPLLNQQHEKPLRLVQITDLHIGFNYDYDDLIYHITLINQQQPDIVVITGDLFDHINRYKGSKAFSALLRTITAPLGVYFIFGNHDQRTHQHHKIAHIIEAAGITLLMNQGEVIHYDGEDIYLLGLDDIINGSGNIEQALKAKHSEMTTVALIHEPDFADFAKKFDIDLQLSGHSHGGQMKLPLLPAPIRPALGRKYVKGLYRLKYKKHRMYLYTSPGLGTTRLPMRMFCPAEITIIDLISK